MARMRFTSERISGAISGPFPAERAQPAMKTNIASHVARFFIRQLRRACGSLNVLRVLLVFLADVFHQFFAGQETCVERHLERLGVCAGIINRDFIDQIAKILSRIPFNRVQLLGVRMAAEIEPELVIESDRIDDESVSLEVSNRMAVPGRVEIFRMLTLVQKDLAIAVDVSFKQEKD